MTRAPQLDSSDADLSLIAVSPIDRAFAALLSSFAEGFTLFAMAHVSMTPVDESYPSEAKAGQLEQISARERPKFLTIVSSTQPEVTKSELESGTGRTQHRFEALSPDASLVERSNARNWLARSWGVIVNRWQNWRREREIEKAVAALVELDDRTFRDIGIPDRSQIEHAARSVKGFDLMGVGIALGGPHLQLHMLQMNPARRRLDGRPICVENSCFDQSSPEYADQKILASVAHLP